MQLDFDRIIRVVTSIPLTPVIANRVRENVAIAREAGCDNGATDLWVPFETVLCVLVPEVECSVRTGGAEGAVLRVEGDAVYRVDFGNVALIGVLLTMAFEGEVQAMGVVLVYAKLC